MRVLITGGAGFVGSHLADRLTARGDEVVVIDNFSTGRRDNLDPSVVRIVEGSIADAAAVDRLVQDCCPEVVVHAAASYKDPDAWVEDAATNTMGTAAVVKAASRAGVQRLVYFQTALCYGLHPDVLPVPITHPLRPEASSYAISKTAGEHYCMLSDLDVISFRLANAYGPRNLSGPLPTFYSRLEQGRPCFAMDTRRDFLYINDLIDVAERALDGLGRRGAYHVSSGSDVSIMELFETTRAAMGLPQASAELRPRGTDDAFTILLDPSETERDFGWEARTPLDEGVAAAVAYYRERGITQTYTHLRVPTR
jgi:UDP-glucose 4-epimerase